MAYEVIMPKFGQQTETSDIIRWLKREGETVAKGDVLLEIQTDKSAMDVESMFDGILLKIYATEGETVPVMSVIGYIGTPGAAVPARPAAPPAAAPAATAAPATAAPKAAQAAMRPTDPTDPTNLIVAAAPPAPSRIGVTPRARALAREALIDVTRAKGSGPNGRILERDVRAYLAEKNHAALKINPAAAALLREHTLDVFDVAQQAEGGRITCADVERVLAERPKPMSAMRKIIARRMAESVQTMPHFFVTVSVDMTDLMEFRKTARREHGLKASVGDFIMKACALTLRAMPVVNSACVGDTIVTRQRVNIGMAVALDDGLIVPVVRNADTLSLGELSERTKDLSERTRTGKLLPDEFAGGTFTISNMGMLGVDHFTAIINPGEGAILAVGAAVETPVVQRGQVVVRTLMKMTLSSDHRVIDGAVAAHFLKKLKETLENLRVWEGEK
ncbi:MAG: dihydrolipoamide acetyltransferase family protein [bacterium]|nr:dihydrolipoamide acetyltransferase family protein [bacterium]